LPGAQTSWTFGFQHLEVKELNDIKETYAKFFGYPCAVPNDSLQARILANQATEAFLHCRVLNKMTQLGMPDSYRVK
jgi:hypothetical protein